MIYIYLLIQKVYLCLEFKNTVFISSMSILIILVFLIIITVYNIIFYLTN